MLVGGHLEIVLVQRQVADDLRRAVLERVQGDDVLQPRGAVHRDQRTDAGG